MEYKKFAEHCKNGDISKVLPLLNNNLLNKYLIEGFQQACEKGHIGIINKILEFDPNINISTNDEYAFRWACHNGKVEVVKLLLKLKPEIDIHAEKEWAFRFACHNYNKYVKDDKHLEIAQLLIDLCNGDIDISIYNYEVYTYAKYHKHNEVLKFLNDNFPHNYK